MQRLYGTWPSSVTAAAVAGHALRFGGVAADGADVCWVEARPSEDGRSMLVRRTPDGVVADAVPSEFNVRTRVHEYGGGAFVVSAGRILCSNSPISAWMRSPIQDPSRSRRCADGEDRVA